MGSNARQNVKNRVEGIVTDALHASHAPPAKPSTNTVLEHFLDIPLLDTLNRINAQVGGLQKQLTKVEFQVATALNPPAAQGDVPKQPGSGGLAATGAAGSSTFLTGVDVGPSVQEPPPKRSGGGSRSVLDSTSHSQMPMGFKDAKSVQHLLMPEPFPGTESLDLPGKLSANDLIKRVSDRWPCGSAKDKAVWAQCLASKEAQNLVKDLFWWFFCEHYKVGQKPAEQEVIFKRMACNFVRLLTQVPHTQKDRFFDRFHSIMANGVFVAYRVALPESEAQFDEKFRSDLCRLSAYWTTGADIGPSSYVLPNGQVVKEDTGSGQIEHVILQLVREQAELEEMTDKRPSRHRGGVVAPTATSRASGGGAPGAAAGGAGIGKTGRGRAGSTVGVGSTQIVSGRKSALNANVGTRFAPGSGSTSAAVQKPPPVPPLRLPVMKHTAQQYTPSAIWTERGTHKSTLAEATASARQLAATSRPAQHSPTETTGDGDAARRSVTSREVASGSLREPQIPKSARSSSSASRPLHRQLATDAAHPGGVFGRANTKRPSGKNHYFDLRETSPFIRYYLTTQVTTTVSARPEWKRLLSDDVCKAWDRPVPPTAPKAKKQKERERPGHDDDEEEEELFVEKVALTPREIAEAAVKKNARMVREYRKKALMRGTGIVTERRTMQTFYTEQRDEMKNITNSQEMSRIFSNLLVSTGGDGKNFELAWKKLGRDLAKDHSKELYAD